MQASPRSSVAVLAAIGLSLNLPCHARADAAAAAPASVVPAPGEATGVSPAAGGVSEWFPAGTVFAPPVADRRWPRFEAGVEQRSGDDNVSNVYAVGIGGTLPFWRSASGGLEAGLQAGVFSTFDRDAPSIDLFNSDYLAATYLAGRRDNASWLVRVLHISTHLGDEFLIHNPEVERENFSFERLDGFLSREFEFNDPLRIRAYAGLGVVVSDPEPDDWGYGRVQWGLELRRPVKGFGRAGFLLAADVQHEDARDFRPDLSLVAGIELPTGRPHSAISLLATYYTGRSPDGQFWRDGVQIIGLRTQYAF